MRAIVRGKPGFGAKSLSEAIAPYLPRGWQVLVDTEIDTTMDGGSVLIEGEEYAGWTFDGYLQPRLASGLYFAERIDDDV